MIIPDIQNPDVIYERIKQYLQDNQILSKFYSRNYQKKIHINDFEFRYSEASHNTQLDSDEVKNKHIIDFALLTIDTMSNSPHKEYGNLYNVGGQQYSANDDQTIMNNKLLNSQNAILRELTSVIFMVRVCSPKRDTNDTRIQSDELLRVLVRSLTMFAHEDYNDITKIAGIKINFLDNIERMNLFDNKDYPSHNSMAKITMQCLAMFSQKQDMDSYFVTNTKINLI